MGRRSVAFALAALAVYACGAQSTASRPPASRTPAVSTSPPASATPTIPAARDYGTPPAGVALIFVQNPGQTGWYTGYDWSGHPRGTVKANPSSNLTQSPDGSLFVTGLGPKGGGQGYLDRLAQPLEGPGNPPTTVNAIWADDSSHMCLVTLDQQTYAWGLSVQQPGQAAQQVAVIAQDQGVGQSGISPVSCGYKNGVAIVLRTSIWWPSELWVIRLSDGSVLSHHAYDSASLVTVAGAPDGAYVAESSSTSQSSNSPGAPSTAIRLVSDWSVAAALSPSYQVLGFSGDGSKALVATQPAAGTVPAHIELIDWRSGGVVWGYGGPDAIYRMLIEPRGSSFALAMGSPTSTGNLNPTGVLIVRGDGTTVALPPGELPTW